MTNYTITEIMEQVYKEFDVYDYQKKTFEELKNEDFSDVGLVHDWRNYILWVSTHGNNSKAVKEWQNLSDIQRLLKYAKAIKESEAEYWD